MLMPAAVIDEPLGIVCTFSDGRQAAFTLAAPLRTALARDLLAGLAGMVHPHGAVDSAKTVDHHMTALRDMTRALAAAGFTGGAAGLIACPAGGVLDGRRHAAEIATRQMLASADAATGCLQPAARELLAGRAYHQPQRTTPLPPYSDAEWSRLIATCRRLTAAAFTAHTAALAAAARGADPREAGWTPENAAVAADPARAGDRPAGRGRTWGSAAGRCCTAGAACPPPARNCSPSRM